MKTTLLFKWIYPVLFPGLAMIIITGNAEENHNHQKGLKAGL